MNRRAQKPASVATAVVIVRPDGIVEAALGDAPAELAGRSVLEAPEVPKSVRAAATALLATPPPTGFVRWAEVVSESGGRVELVAIEALPLRRTHTRVDDLVGRTLDAFVAQARSSAIDLTVQRSPQVPDSMFVDAEKVAWALATVVGNALRYAPRGRARSPHVHVRATWDDHHDELVFTVTDNGPGMSEERARWLFERDPRTGIASGLALLMVRDVMVAHRGSASVVSRIDHGTTIRLTLPKVSS